MNSSEALRSSVNPERARIYVNPKGVSKGKVNSELRIDEQSFPSSMFFLGTTIYFETADGFHYEAQKSGEVYGNEHGDVKVRDEPSPDPTNDYCHISFAPPAYSAFIQSRDPMVQLRAIGEKSPNAFFTASLKRLVEIEGLLTSRDCKLGVPINALQTIISAIPKSHVAFFDQLPTLEPSQDLEARRLASLALCRSAIKGIERALNYPKSEPINSPPPSAIGEPIHNPLTKPTALGASLFCFLALLPDLPYEYFSILRLVVFAAALLCAADQFKLNRRGLAWACVGLGMVFNPIVKVHFGRELWMLVDVLAGAFLCLVAFHSKARPSTATFKGQ